MTDVDEMANENSIRYTVPKFRASAAVTFPKIPANETWQVAQCIIYCVYYSAKYIAAVFFPKIPVNKTKYVAQFGID